MTKLINKVVALLFVGACVGCKPPAEKNVVTLGAILDLTGPAASFGKSQREGLDLAVEQINSAPPCGYSFQLNVEDSRLDAKLALNAATKLAYQDHASAVVSITGSSMALVTAPVFNRAKIPVVDSLSSAPSLTDEGGAFYFRIQPPDSFAGTYISRWAAHSLGIKTAAIVYATSDWGQGLRDAILSGSTAQRITILAIEKADLGQVDFRPTILRLQRLTPNAIFLVAHPQEAGLFIKQASELHYSVSIIGSDSLSTDEVRTAAGQALDGVKFCLASSGSGARYEEFQSKFKEKYGKAATVNSVKPYDCVQIVSRAVCSGGGPAATSIAQFLRNLKGFRGVSGSLSFDEHGDITNPTYDCFAYKGKTFAPFSDR